MKKTQLTLVLGCFGLAVLLSLLDLFKITTSAGSVSIQIYPAAGLALLGALLLWRTLKKALRELEIKTRLW